MGWLHGKPKDETRSRVEIFKEFGGPGSPLPDVGPGQYLVEAFKTMRFAKTGPMGGLLPQEWGDVLAFAQATEAVSEPWEIATLHEMSQAYVNEYGKELATIAPVDRKPMND